MHGCLQEEPGRYTLKARRCLRPKSARRAIYYLICAVLAIRPSAKGKVTRYSNAVSQYSATSTLGPRYSALGTRHSTHLKPGGDLK